MASEKTASSQQENCVEKNLPKFSSIAEATLIARHLEDQLFRKDQDIKAFLDTEHSIQETTEQQESLRKKAKKMQAFRMSVYDLRDTDAALDIQAWCTLSTNADRLMDKIDKLDSMLRKDKNDLKQKGPIRITQFFTLVLLIPATAYNLLKATMPEDSKIPIMFSLMYSLMGAVYHYREELFDAWKNAKKETEAQQSKITAQKPRLKIVGRKEAQKLRNEFLENTRRTTEQIEEGPKSAKKYAGKFHIIIDNGSSPK